jgi:hypothetical protein
MRTILIAFMAVGLISVAATETPCDPGGVAYSWGLHYAGQHNSKVNTCGLTVVRCFEGPVVDLVSQGPEGPGDFDIYVVALCAYNGFQGTRFGLCSADSFYFYGWRSCGDLQTNTPGWPGRGEGVSVTWNDEQAGPFVTIGILDVYVYAGLSTMEICPDPRVGYCGWSGSRVPGQYKQTTNEWRPAFGVIGFGTQGYNPCPCPGVVPVERNTWGRIKATYR